MTDQTKTTTPLPRPAIWQAENPHAATPRCPNCETPYLGIIPAYMSVTKRDEWSCDYCGVVG
jgi:hypothetical protein